jgi:hypothetical protein
MHPDDYQVTIRAWARAHLQAILDDHITKTLEQLIQERIGG